MIINVNSPSHCRCAPSQNQFPALNVSTTMTKSAYLSLASSRCSLWGCRVYSIIRSVQVLYTNWQPPLPDKLPTCVYLSRTRQLQVREGDFSNKLTYNCICSQLKRNYQYNVQSRCLAWSKSELNANQVLLPINIAHSEDTLSAAPGA